MHQIFITSQDWQHCKEDPVPSRELFIDELYNIGVHLNLGREICTSRPLVLISVRSDKAGLEQSGASGKEGKTGDNTSYMITITNASTTTSTTTPPKVGAFGNTLRDNLQFANGYPFMPSLSSKSISGNEIHSDKADSSTLCIMPKPTIIEEVDDDGDDTNIESASRVRIVSARDNQTH